MLLNSFLLRFLPISALMFLIGCTPAQVASPSNTTRTCQAAQFESLLWKPESALNTVVLPKGTRVILPGQAVTMDFRTDRMNITIGKLGRVERVFCG